MSTAPLRAPAADVPTEIPILDVGPFLAGVPGARGRLGGELRHAFQRIGFYFIRNHGVPQELIDRVFAEAARFHAQPADAKLRLKLNSDSVGYVGVRGSTTRHSKINPNNKPNVNEAFFVKRDLPPDHPDVLAGKKFRGLNQWPDSLPGFRETVLEYCAAMERLAA